MENKSFTQAKNKDIHHQTPADLLQNAGTTIKHSAQDNIEIIAKENQVIVVEDENMEITVEGPGGMRVHIKNDALHIQSAKEIRIEGNGGGDITLHQSGGGVCVTAAGNVKLFGNDIQIEGDNGVSLNGTVSYTIGSGARPAPEVDFPLNPSDFAILERALRGAPFCVPCMLVELYSNLQKDENVDPEIYDLNWSISKVHVGQSVNATFNVRNFEVSEAATISVYEWNPGNIKQLVATLSVQIEKGVSEYAIVFSRNEDDALDDLKADQETCDPNPLQYRFEVQTNLCNSEDLSDILNLTFDIRDSDDQPYEN
ncbi:hypothetical protein MNBD_GAMMA12-2476 [hydrothermal vent metagenome]|uniref:DUF2345 domain-containing protein n=1 Tax=hydrothermal vent metagenome TaxID=652676 RepID=A0A3B0Z8P6_9ZZZZ